MIRGASETSGSPLIVLMGPTASGKSRVALALARELGAEIVSADSMQVYRGMDIGTDKVSNEVRNSVPHHLIDVAEPSQRMDAAQWVSLADRAIELIHGKGRVAIVAGGTGLYVRGLLKGFFEGPSRDERTRSVLRRMALHKEEGWLHRFLLRLDPAAAEKIEPADTKRLLRALEVILLDGVRFSERMEQWQRQVDRYPALKICLTRPRMELARRIDARVEEMYHHGLLDEVETLIGTGVPPDATAMKAIGYREAALVLRGVINREEAIRRTQSASRQYAKRQMTWFRGEDDLHWIDASQDEPETVAEIVRLYSTLKRSLLDMEGTND